MNRQIARLFTAFALGFALLHRVHRLLADLGRRLAHGPPRQPDRGRPPALDQARADPGRATARCWRATRSAQDRDGRKVYLRLYPTKGLFAHVVGYSSPSANRAGSSSRTTTT